MVIVLLIKVIASVMQRMVNLDVFLFYYAIIFNHLQLAYIVLNVPCISHKKLIAGGYAVRETLEDISCCWLSVRRCHLDLNRRIEAWTGIIDRGSVFIVQIYFPFMRFVSNTTNRSSLLTN